MPPGGSKLRANLAHEARMAKTGVSLEQCDDAFISDTLKLRPCQIDLHPALDGGEGKLF
jgi:hypothetical protein